MNAMKLLRCHGMVSQNGQHSESECKELNKSQGT